MSSLYFSFHRTSTRVSNPLALLEGPARVCRMGSSRLPPGLVPFIFYGALQQTKTSLSLRCDASSRTTLLSFCTKGYTMSTHTNTFSTTECLHAASTPPPPPKKKLSPPPSPNEANTEASALPPAARRLEAIIVYYCISQPGQPGLGYPPKKQYIYI